MNRPATSRAAERCGVRLPIFQAGMAGLAGPELAAEVSNAGGLGHLGGLRLAPKALRQLIRKTRELTDKPFGVNLVPQYGGPEVFDASLRVVFEERPKALSLFYGDFGDVIPRARDAGIVTMVQVGSVAEARKVVREGADIVIVQGVEAGGHVRGTIGLMAFLPAVLDVVEGRPILAAGGIMDEITVRAAMSMGADGVWVGTIFVAAEESMAHEIYKRRLIEACADDAELLTDYSFGWKFGTPHRAIKSKLRFNHLRFVSGGARVVDSPLFAERLTLYAGQGVGKITEVLPTKEIVRRLERGLDHERPHR